MKSVYLNRLKIRLFSAIIAFVVVTRIIQSQTNLSSSSHDVKLAHLKHFKLSQHLFLNHKNISTNVSSSTGFVESNFPTANPTIWNPLVSLFDLSVDPYEEYDVSNHPNYSSIVRNMTERALYWTKMIVPGDINNTGLLPAWWSCNAICPWRNDTSPPLAVKQKYFPKNPPNIVFFMVDDWGWNDIGLRSTYLNWTTPHIDSMARSGVQLNFYFTHWTCTPSRSAFLTGRYPTRQGTWVNDPVRAAQSTVEMPLSEVTLAQELKSAGYRNYLIGKWHVGFSSPNRMPLQRGFDDFYGFLNGGIDYYSKVYRHWTDLMDGNEPVRNKTELNTFAPHLFSTKMADAVALHAEHHRAQPMFLFASTPLVHAPYQALPEYLERCIQKDLGYNESHTLYHKLATYCAMNLMLDETVANLSCALKKHGLDKNLLYILASDNGGVFAIPGTSHPLRGHKSTTWRGGVGATSFVTGDYLPSTVRGQVYNGLMHVTDWLPTLMGIATEGKWTGGLTNAELDGVDMWAAITHNLTSPRSEILHFTNGGIVGGGLTSYQFGSYKMRLGANENMKQSGWRKPVFEFLSDQNPSLANKICNA